jgi:hypothetical protein
MQRIDSASMQHGRALMAAAREHEEQAGRVYDELMAAIAPAVPSKRQAVSQFVAASHGFASVVLRSPHDYQSHVVDFATGILNEALAFAQADMNVGRKR